MSTPEMQAQLGQLADHLARQGGYGRGTVSGYAPYILWESAVPAETATGREAPGNAVVIDFDAQAWATGNKRLIVASEPYTGGVPQQQGFYTAYHGDVNRSFDNSSVLHVYMEQPAAFGDALDLFARNIQAVLQGQWKATVVLHFCANGTQPELKGVQGAAASAAFPAELFLSPNGDMAVPGAGN